MEQRMTGLTTRRYQIPGFPCIGAICLDTLSFGGACSGLSHSTIAHKVDGVKKLSQSIVVRLFFLPLLSISKWLLFFCVEAKYLM